MTTPGRDGPTAPTDGRARHHGRGVMVLGALAVVVVSLLGAAGPGPGAGTAGAAGAATPAPHPTLAPMGGAYVFHVTFDGLTREYRLHVPPAAASGRPLPLVLNLAGATQNDWLEEITSDMDPNADLNGYLVAYPDGTRISTTWVSCSR